MLRGKERGAVKKEVSLTFLANWVVRIFGSTIFLILTWYSMRYTQYVEPGWQEIPNNMPDSMVWNMLFLVLAVGVFAGLLVLEKKLSERVKNRIMRGTLVLLCLWIGSFSLWWITTVDRQPVGDQAYIYGGASYFLEGNYSFLQEGGYCSYYPHQLGLIALMEVLFLIVGSLNYFAVQVICAQMAVGIAIFGYLLVRELSKKMAVAVFYCLTMFACLPLIFYTGWVYGDIPCIFFSLITAWCLLRYVRSSKWGWLVGMVLAVVLALLVRKNSLIMLIALCLVTGVYALQKKDKKLLVAVALTAALSCLVYAGIYKMYEIRSGYEHEEGIPAASFIAMGMQEDSGKCGWYTQYCKEVFQASGFDAEAASELSKQDIKWRLEEFIANPSYTWNFYREKILSQWNAPLYQSIFFSVQYWEGKEPYCDSDIYRLTNVRFFEVLGICNRMQFILYVGMLCYFLFAVRKDSNILQHLLAVTIIGGFLFSIIWEAKARYVFPYYVTMYPLAAMGYWQMLRKVQALFGRRTVRYVDEEEVELEQVA